MQFELNFIVIFGSKISSFIFIKQISSLIVRGLLRVRVSRIAGPTSRELHLGMTITLGTIPSVFPVF